MSVGQLKGAESYDSAQNRSSVTRSREEDPSFDEALAVASSRPPERSDAGAQSGGKAEAVSTQNETAGAVTGSKAASKPSPDSKSGSASSSDNEGAGSTRIKTDDLPGSKGGEARPAEPKTEAAKSHAEGLDRSAMITNLARAVASAVTDRATARTAATSQTPGTVSGASAAAPSVDVRGGGASGQGVDTNQADAHPAPTEASAKAQRPAGEQQPTSQVTVRFADPGGGEGRLRVAVRGEAIHATILSGDHQTVQRLMENRAELRQNLRDRGFAETELSVREIGRHARRGGGHSRGMETEVLDD